MDYTKASKTNSGGAPEALHGVTGCGCTIVIVLLVFASDKSEAAGRSQG